MFFYRFASSSVDSLKSIYRSYSSLITCYERNRQVDDANSETFYKVRGWDFTIALVIYLDLFEPLSQLMVRAQSVAYNIWSIVDDCEGVLRKMESMRRELSSVSSLEELCVLPASLFPLTAKHADELANLQFHGLELKEGWLITDEKAGEVNWAEATQGELLSNLTALSEMLHSSLLDR